MNLQKQMKIKASFCYEIYHTPLGKLMIQNDDSWITQVAWEDCCDSIRGQHQETSLTLVANRQIQEYFLGRRQQFQLPLKMTGTNFQLKVWHALQKIMYGCVSSYKEIAETIGNPKASRAVGTANSRNPIVIIVPCHRIIAANGKLSGYNGGVWRKQALLDLECTKAALRCK